MLSKFMLPSCAWVHVAKAAEKEDSEKWSKSHKNLLFWLESLVLLWEKFSTSLSHHLWCRG